MSDATVVETAPPEPAPSAQPPAEAEPVAPPGRAATHVWLRRADQVVLAVLAAAVGLLMAWHYARLSGWGTREVEVERLPERQYEYRIDVNAATWVEWVQLPGIGETLARRIIEDREAHGPFHSIDDLDRVPGIGPKTLENLRPWLRVEDGGR